MSPVLSFALLAVLLVAGALLLVLPPLFGAGLRRRSAKVSAGDVDQAATALTVLREQLADLEAERAAGGIDDETYRRSRDDLERRALDEGETAAEAVVEVRPSRRWAAVVAVGVPVVAAAMYFALGTPDGLDPEKIAGGQNFSEEQIAEMVGTLAARLEKEPDNAEGWAMLARSYAALKDFSKAADAYAHLAKLMPDDPDMMADWADTVAARNGTLVGEAEALIDKTLAIDPDNLKGLLLAGTVAYQKGDYASASARWERILGNVPPGEEAAASSLRKAISDAREKGGLPPLAAAASPAATENTATGGKAGAAALTLAGRLELAPALRERVGPEDSVFVFVRAGGGPPLSALRFKAGELPRDFSFVDAPRMMNDGQLPGRVTLAARISKSGDATARAGDLEGRIENLAPDASGVALVIDQVRK